MNWPRRREQAEATRKEILDAAQRLFERRGYPATSIPSVAEEAGMAEDDLRLLRHQGSTGARRVRTLAGRCLLLTTPPLPHEPRDKTSPAGM
jgi:Bacterial regulatory proteins, tetR family